MSAFLLKKPDCVLIHIPKSAGSSIRMGIWQGKYDGPYFGPLPKKLHNYFKFAFVRNPYDRLVSILRMFRDGVQQSGNDRRRWTPKSDLTVSEVLDITEDENVRFDERRNSFEEIIKHHSIPMTHPFNAIDEADFIGRFETLQQDWAKICTEIGLRDSQLPHLNFTKKQDNYRAYFDEATVERTRKIYAEDLERFEYEF